MRYAYAITAALLAGGDAVLRRLDGDRRDYQRYLEQVRGRVRRAAEAQRSSSLWHHPDPDCPVAVVGQRLLRT